MDVRNFYFETPFDYFEYMKIKANLMCEEFKQQCNLYGHNGFALIESKARMYGLLPHAGILEK